MHVAVAPEVRLEGLHDTELKSGPEVGSTARINDALWVLLLYEPVITAVRLTEIVPAVAVNVAVLELAGTSTLAGIASNSELLESVTVAPPAPATWDNEIVHVDFAPEFRLEGEHATELNTVLDTPPEMVASNSKGGSPLMSARTVVSAPAAPVPKVKFTDA